MKPEKPESYDPETLDQALAFTGRNSSPIPMLTVVGPSAYERQWYAQVWCDANEIITK